MFRDTLLDTLRSSLGTELHSHGSRYLVQLVSLPNQTGASSIEVVRTSDRLATWLDLESSFGDGYGGASDLEDSLRTARLIRVAAAGPSDLARLLRTRGVPTDLWPSIRAALERSDALGIEPIERDALRFLAHLLVRKLVSGTPASDSSRAREIGRRLAPYGGALTVTHDGDLCYNGAIAESLAADPARSRWSEEAFLERNYEGWEPLCGLCGWETAYGPDEWRAVIERAEPFVNSHPSSGVTRELRLLLAEAHETAWSLSKALDDEYFDSSKYRIDGPRHRTEAIRFYEEVLASNPRDLRTTEIRIRLNRIRLNVDTSYHRFWCLWD